MQEQIMSKLDTLQKETVEARKSYETLKESNDILVKEKISKIDEASEKTLKELDELKAKQDEQKKIIEELEKAKYRKGFGSEKVQEEVFAEYSKEVDYCLRSKRKETEPSDEIRNKVSEVLMPKLIKTYGKDFDIKLFNTIVKPEGGYWIKPELMSNPITRSFETSPVRQVSNVIPTGANSLIFPIDDDELQILENRKEGAAPETESDTTEMGELEIQTHLLEAKPAGTLTMIEDLTFDLQGYIMNKAERDFARKENTWFVSGNGSMKAKGFLTYPAWSVAGAYERGKIEQRETASSGVVKADDFFDLESDLHEDFQSNAVWMCQRKSFNAVRKLKDGQGQYLLSTTAFPDGIQHRLLGKPLFFASDMPAISAGNLSFVYGDFKVGYTIVDRLGITLLVDPYTKSNRVIYKMRKRAGGAVTKYDALKLLKIKA